MFIAFENLAFCTQFQERLFDFNHEVSSREMADKLSK
jgi:hypothetical protein